MNAIGRVAQDQNLGTLVGLQRGLLLQRSHEQKLLLPHAKTLRASSGNHCEVDLDMSELRDPPLFAYSVRADLRELRGPKDRVAWLYLAKLHALTSHVLRDPFTMRTGTETALCLLRSARCRGNLYHGINGSPGDVAERTLQEISRLAPARTSQKAGERVDFQRLPALCAHEGLAFLASDAMMEMVEQKQLMGLKGKNCPKDCVDRCGALARRAYVRSSGVFGSARLTVEEETSFVQESRTWKPACWREHFGSCCKVREVACVVFNEWLPPPQQRPCLKSLLLLTEDLKGCLDFCCEEQGVGEWELGSQSGLRQMWIGLFQAAMRSSKEKYGLMLGYFASQWPKHVGHLQLLGSICVCREDFQDLRPPSYSSYERPDERDLNLSTVLLIINQRLAPFMDDPPKSRSTRREQEQAERAFRQREQEHQQQLLQSCSRLSGLVLLRWQQGLRELKTEDCSDSMVPDARALARALTACFERWRRAAELHDFLDAVQRRIGQHGGKGNVDVGFERLEFPAGGSEAFSLLEPEVSELEEDDLDELWTTGATEQYVLEPPFQPPPRRQQELHIVPDPHSEISKIHEELCVPLRESWRLAREKPTQHVGHSFFPPNLRQRLQDALKERQGDTERAWERVLQAVQGKERFDDMMRRCGLREVIGSYAIALRAEQRMARCLRLLDMPDMVAWLVRELQQSSTGCVNWRPQEQPGWLLLEIDNDFCIREQQAETANALMCAQENQLLQLNMGEGKPLGCQSTAVIVRMLVAALADGQNLLRITVLSSLLTANAADWQMKRLG
ncbi:unnamed protein product [Effrenium voratum]|nr:unnamed protein product [Effrenium voratum]